MNKQINIAFDAGMGRGDSTYSQNMQLVNWFPRATPNERSPTQLVSIQGGALIGTATPSNGSGCRGLWRASTGPASEGYVGTLYGVFGDSLVRIKKDGTQVKIGTLQNTVSMCSFAENQDQTTSGVQGFVCDGVTVYTWNLLAEDDALSASYAEAALPYVKGSLTERAIAKYISYNAYRLILTAQNSVQWYFSELNSSEFKSISFESSESNPDKTVRAISHGNNVWVLGSYSYDIYSPTFNSSDPFDQGSGASGKIGCASGDSVASIGDLLFWLGQGDASENAIVMADKTGAISIISTSGISRLIAEWDYKELVRGFAWTESGHTFYAVSSERAKMTLVYDVTTGMWHRRSSSNTGALSYWDVTSVNSCYGKNWYATLRTNAICQFSPNVVKSHTGKPITRLWQGPTITANGDYLKIIEIKVDVECGSYDKSAPSHAIAIQTVWDGRESERVLRSLGQAGDNTRQVAVCGMGLGRSLTIRISTSSEAPVILYGVRLDVSTSGRTA